MTAVWCGLNCLLADWLACIWQLSRVSSSLHETRPSRAVKVSSSDALSLATQLPPPSGTHSTHRSTILLLLFLFYCIIIIIITRPPEDRIAHCTASVCPSVRLSVSFSTYNSNSTVIIIIITRGQSNLTKSGPIPRLGVTPGGRKLYHWIPGVGFPISVP